MNFAHMVVGFVLAGGQKIDDRPQTAVWIEPVWTVLAASNASFLDRPGQWHLRLLHGAFLLSTGVNLPAARGSWIVEQAVLHKSGKYSGEFHAWVAGGWAIPLGPRRDRGPFVQPKLRLHYSDRPPNPVINGTTYLTGCSSKMPCRDLEIGPGVDVGYQIWTGHRVYIALIFGLNAGICINCENGTTILGPTDRDGDEEARFTHFVFGINPNILRIGASF